LVGRAKSAYPYRTENWLTSPLEDNNAKDDNNNNDDDNDNDDVDLPHNGNNVDLPCEERLVIDIVGIASGDRGCKCREHNVCCGEVLSVDC
jgi:hypothetical protein